jgi:hypothetical protein
MPRYFFHMLEQNDRRPDPDGVELPDDTAAVNEATKAAREFIVEAVMTGAIVDGQIIEIVDADGREVHRLPLKSVLRTE